MANVGKKTGKRTQAGRDVYETPEGEMVSEKSTTFEYKGKWINIPTIHGGKQYSEDQLIEMLDKGLIKPTSTHEKLEEAIQAAQSRSDSLEFNKGGTPMLEKQMELFEDGGLRDEGGMVDEESGNEVPVGSTRKEVRDDIPAMLSEGEFVFPADVVRFIGLEKLMKIRQNAKQGLKQMEAMGQMGNSDEATMPDDLPFGMMDLIIVEGEEEEPEEKAHGGVVHMQEGGLLTSPSFTVPKFDPRNQDVRQYENAEGKKLNIPFLGGKPVYPIPEGYFPVGTVIEEEKDQTKEAIPTDDDDDPSGAGQVTNAFTEAGSWEGSPLDMYIKEAEKVSTFGNVAAGVMTATVPVLGAFVALANKNQKKRILATIDARIEEAKKTDVPGQVAALREVKDRLTNPERKGILGGIVGEIIDGIADGLGLSKAEKVTAKVVSNLGATVDPTESNEKTTDTQEKLLKELTAKGFKLGSPDDAVPKGALSFGSLVPKSPEEIIKAVKTLPLTDEVSSELAPDESLRPRARPELTEQQKFTSGEIGKSEVSSELAPDESLRPVSKPEELKGDINTLSAENAEILGKAGIDINRADYNKAIRYLALANTQGNDPDKTKAIQFLKKYKNRIEKPITSDTAIPPSTSSSLSPPTVEEQTEEILLPSDKTGADTIRGAVPTDTAAVATKPEQVTGGLGEVKTRAEDRQDFELITANEELQNALQAIRSADATNLLMQKNVDAKNKAEELLNQLTSSLAGRNEGRSDEPEAGPSNVPTAYEAGQQRRKPKEKTPTPSSSNNNDDGPSLAERMQKDSGKGRDTGIKVKTDDVTIKDRTDSSGKKVGDAGYKSKLRERKEKEKASGAAKSYADIAKENDPFGLLNKGGLIKKGGLASRKK